MNYTIIIYTCGGNMYVVNEVVYTHSIERFTAFHSVSLIITRNVVRNGRSNVTTGSGFFKSYEG
jgi:hypothetical protein